jgi:hypothetical protein
LSLAEFKASFYRRAPLLVRGGATAILGRLFSPADFKSWHERMLVHHRPYISGGNNSTAVLRVSTIVADLAPIAAAFTHEFPGTIAAFDCFLTGTAPGGSVGAHFDDQDNFILHQSGHKRWKLARPEHIHPESAYGRAVRHERIGHVIMPDAQFEYVLGPGDLLYIPSFWVHWGIALGESLSLSLALNTIDTAQALQRSEIWPSVDLCMKQPPGLEAPCPNDPAPGLEDLWQRAVGSIVPTIGVTYGLLDSASRSGLSRLLERIRELGGQPVTANVRERFVRCVASLAAIPAKLGDLYLASSLFAFLAERAADAILFADTYKLREVGEVMADHADRIRRAGTVNFADLIEAARDAPSLPELKEANSIVSTWQALAGVNPVLAELGLRFSPVIRRTSTNGDERTSFSASLRLAAAPPDSNLSDLGAYGEAAYALGYRAGRANARALPAFASTLADAALPALTRDETLALGRFADAFGWLAAADLAGRVQGSKEREALLEVARERIRELSTRRTLSDAGRERLNQALTSVTLWASVPLNVAARD